jgi:hypothetical protein
VKAYLSVAELAMHTPWTEPAIRTMIARGVFKRNRHYFQPTGPRGQVIFSWQAVVEYIEGNGAGREPRNCGLAEVELDLDEIRAKAKELLR